MPHSLIQTLDRLALDRDGLVAEVHRQWMGYRQSEGWVLGPPDRDKRSSPYLKSLGCFTSLELRREICLALNDVRGIKAAIVLFYSRKLDGADSSLSLRELALDCSFLEMAAVNIHDGWSRINRRFKTNPGDERLLKRFHSLSTSDRTITLSNVRADIEAMANLAARNTPFVPVKSLTSASGIPAY